jgi:outer membrane protein assembly factor BamB
VDADRIYTVSADGLLTCLRTADGTELWRRHYANDFLSHPRHWGFCDYPLVDGERLVCVPGGPKATVAALNKHTGALLWKTLLPGEEVNHYAAPVLSTAGGIRHYVVFLRNGLTGFAAEDGRILWRYGRTTAHLANSYTPIVRNDLLLSANGYGGGMALLRIVPEEDGLAVVEQYRRRFHFNPFQDNTVWAGDHIYAVRGAGELVCFDLATGALVWEERDDNPKRRAAFTYAEGHLYVRRSDGSMSLVEAAPRGYVVKHSFRIPNPEEVSGVTFPVIAGGRLYLRDNDRLLCYDVRADALAQPRAEPKTLSVLLNRGSGPAGANPPAVSRTGVDRPPDVIFVPTPGDVVERMIGLAALDANSVLYDLGSGDGRIVIAAARTHGCRAVGYEIDPRLVEQSREAVRAQGLDHLVRIEHADFFTVDLSGADAVAVYLPSNLLDRLRPQFDKLKRGARIVSHQFRVPGTRYEPPVDLISKEDGDRHLVYHYTMPIQAPGP